MKRHCVRRTFKWQIFLVISVIWVAVVPAVFAAEFNVYGISEGFTWKEFGDDNALFLKESGRLYGVGFSYWQERADSMTLKPTVEISGGTADSVGQACDAYGNCKPATAQVDYYGIKFEGDLGRRFHEAYGVFIEPFGGLGLRFWTRDIKDGRATDGSLTIGHTEDWEMLYTRLGLRGGVYLTEENQLFAEAGMKYPLYTENNSYLSEIGGTDVTLIPGNRLSLFAEAGVKINQFKGSVFFDSMRFSKSRFDTEGSIAYWQPRSSADFVGVKAGIAF